VRHRHRSVSGRPACARHARSRRSPPGRRPIPALSAPLVTLKMNLRSPRAKTLAGFPTLSLELTCRLSAGHIAPRVSPAAAASRAPLPPFRLGGGMGSRARRRLCCQSIGHRQYNAVPGQHGKPRRIISLPCGAVRAARLCVGEVAQSCTTTAAPGSPMPSAHTPILTSGFWAARA